MLHFNPGRLIHPDIRDTAHLMADYLPPANADIAQEREWAIGPILNQLRVPQCAAFAWEQFLQSEPIPTLTGPPPADLYQAAQQIDGIAGAHDGTTVRAVAKVLDQRGYLGNYVWGQSADELARFVLTRGTVVVGTSWLREMFYPDANHCLHVNGDHVGGHAYLIYGYSSARRAFRLANSFGTEWGDGGSAYLAFDDMQRLFMDFGEICSAIEITVPATK